MRVPGLAPAFFVLALVAALPVSAEQVIELVPRTLLEWKPVYGRVEARNTVPARARIGGTIVELGVTEGDAVRRGDQIALVRDDKIAFQISAMDAQLRALEAELIRARAGLERGQSLVERGVSTAQRLEQLETDVEVIANRIASVQAERSVLVQQAEEGAVLAPADGRVLAVPVTSEAVIMAGEPVATIAGGGVFLRLAIPERHAADLHEGAELQITSNGALMPGRLVRLYPQIENGRVIADVEAERMNSDFIDARVLVRVPVGSREGLVVPQAAIQNRAGLDFVRVREGGQEVDRAIIPGEAMVLDGAEMVEILTGLHAGDMVLVP